MSILGNEMNALNKKGDFGVTEKFVPSYHTGLDLLDYRLGKYNQATKSIQTGVQGGGRIIGLVGASGGGKSSLAISMGYQMIHPYEEGLMTIYNFEHGLDRSRVQQLTGAPDEEYDAKINLMDSDINAEKFYNYVNTLCEQKIKMAKELLIDTGEVINGEKIKKLPPSVVVIDSIPTMQSKKALDTDEINAGMSGAASARFNNDMFKKLVGSSILQEANVNIIYINHVTTKISINMFQPAPAELTQLPPNESLPGGSSVRYLTDTLLRITPGAKLKADKDFYITGNYTHIIVMKSRTNESGQVFDAIFSPKVGFINELTNFDVLSKAKKIAVAGPRSRLDGYSTPENGRKEIYFTKKNFLEIYHDPENSEFRQYFDELVQDVYRGFISEPQFQNKELIDAVDKDALEDVLTEKKLSKAEVAKLKKQNEQNSNSDSEEEVE